MDFRESRTAAGQLELAFDDATEFRNVADIVESVFGGRREEELRDVAQIWRDYVVDGRTLTLHLDDMAGLFLIAADAAGEPALRRIGEYLKRV